MKLTVLGGAAAGGNPGQGCSGYLVGDGSTTVVLDLGPGTLPELRLHADFRTLDAIVISHLHLDHILDLLALRYALAYNPEPAPRPVPLWLPPDGIGFLKRLAAVLADEGEADDYFAVFAMSEYDPDVSRDIGSVTIRFAPTVHYVPCWAMRLTSEYGSGDLIYTADTGPAAQLVPFATGATVMIAEAGALEPEKELEERRGHLTASEAARWADEAEVGLLVLTHLWHEQNQDKIHRQAGEIFAGDIEIARPGLTLEW